MPPYASTTDELDTSPTPTTTACFNESTTTSSSSSDSNKKEKKTVTFASSPQIEEIESFCNLLTLEEKANVWYNRDESTEIIRQCLKIVKKMNRGYKEPSEAAAKTTSIPALSSSSGDDSSDDSDSDNDNNCNNTTKKYYCTRGLEQMTIIGKYKLHRNRKAALSTVLGQQRLQMVDNTNDPEFLALVYYYSTSRCKTEAQIRGVQDSKHNRSIN